MRVIGAFIPGNHLSDDPLYLCSESLLFSREVSQPAVMDFDCETGRLPG